MSLTITINDKCSQKSAFYGLLQMNLVRCYKIKGRFLLPLSVERSGPRYER